MNTRYNSQSNTQNASIEWCIKDLHYIYAYKFVILSTYFFTKKYKETNYSESEPFYFGCLIKEIHF